jgi:hypothetical protein
MRSRVLAISGLLGAILGAVVAYVGAVQVFVCGDGPGVGIPACAEPDVLLAVGWGIPIGLAAGLIAGLTLSRRSGAR